MCGIVGIFSKQCSVSKELLKNATDAIVHRGPDDEGFFVSNNNRAGLGHRRLSIIDLNTGHQPLSSQDGKIIAVVNGELYGYQEIRSDLIAKGYKFKTNSDSEIIVHLYKEYGTNCLQYLRGEFAFIIWDEIKQQLFAARDRFGIKPLCYTQTEEGCFLASEAKAIFAMGIKAEWDDYAFFHSANMQYTPQDRTLFKNIYQLKPGHALIAKTNGLETFKYWDMSYPTQDNLRQFSNEQEAIDEFSSLFEEAVSLRLQSDVPLCFQLSGGIDSAAVLGVASKLMSSPAHAFTVSFEHDIYDEFYLAEEMAKQAGALFHPVKVTQEDIVKEMSNAVYHGEGMAINGHITAKYLLNKQIKNAGFKVSLTGEGSDEILAGYPHLRQDLFRTENNGDLDNVDKTNLVSAGVQIAFGDRLSTKAVKEQLGFTPAFLEAKASMGLRMMSILSDEFINQNCNIDIYKDFINATPVKDELLGRHPVQQSSWLWTKTALANYILRTLGDGMEMSSSIEGRVPFLDHKLFEFTRMLPMNFKIKNGIEKYILREAVKSRVTETIYKRQKHPFMAPPVSKFSNPLLMDFIRDTINSVSFANMRFYNQSKIINLIDKLPHLEEREMVATEPILMMILTSNILKERFRL